MLLLLGHSLLVVVELLLYFVHILLESNDSDLVGLVADLQLLIVLRHLLVLQLQMLSIQLHLLYFILLTRLCDDKLFLLSEYLIELFLIFVIQGGLLFYQAVNLLLVRDRLSHVVLCLLCLGLDGIRECLFVGGLDLLFHLVLHFCLQLDLDL